VCGASLLAMGIAGSVAVHPDVESPTCPGERSAVSEPIGEDLVDNMDEFFGEVVSFVRNPLNILVCETVYLKELDLQERSIDDFTVRVVLDGAKLHSIIRSKFPDHAGDLKDKLGDVPEGDFCRLWVDYVIDRRNCRLHSTTYKPNAGGEKEHDVHMVFVPNKEEKNFRIEVWRIASDGQRDGGQLMANMVDWFYLKPLLVSRSGLPVKVHSDVHMPETGGLSVVTDSLDSYFTPEKLFEALTHNCKQEALKNNGEVVTKSDFEFQTSVDVKLPWLKDMTINLSRQVVADDRGLQLVFHDYFMEELALTHFFRIHRDPVRVEFWRVFPNGTRSSGSKEACALRVVLKGLISEADVKAQAEEVGEQFIF